MKIPENFIFFAYDGDSVGSRVGRATMDNDLDELTHISGLIHAGHELVKRWVKDHDGIWINGGGDEGLAAIPGDKKEELEHLRKDYEYLVGHTISIGVGKEPSESGRALLIAKLKGKNQIVEFGEATEREIRKIKKRAKKGAFKSMEEHKLAEAYLKKSEIAEEECPYCQQTDGVDPDHCKWCHDAEVQDGEENCPYCKDMQNDPPEGDKMPEVGEEDCAYCKKMDQEGQDACPYCQENAESAPDDSAESTLLAPRIGTSPDSTNEQAPAGSPEEKELFDRMDMAPPEIGKPLPPDQRPPIGQNAPMDVVPKTPEQEESRFVDGDHGASLAPGAPNDTTPIDPEDNHSKEALKAIAAEIERGGQPTTQEVDAVDDTALPVSQEAEGNISRPSGFAQNTPQDMGTEGPNPPPEPTDEEDPDFYSVLEDGLDDHADGIHRERTIQIVSQALTQFKASKNTLENIKMQAPDLYAASISMLKAMIEMASMLGLGPSSASAQPQPQQELGAEQAAITPEMAAPEAKPPEEQNDEWHDPFPTHPDQGGTPKKEHAPSANNPKKEGDGAVGQPIGKLSAKHTTAHVARVPTPPGAINEKGQQKVIDPKTGKTRWIDRKQGMVQSPTGVPIKSPSRGPQNVPKN